MFTCLAVVGCTGGTTATPPGPPDPPLNLSIVHRTPHSLTLSWQAPHTVAESYEIYRDDSLVGSVDGDALKYSDTGLLPTERYLYVVRSVAGNLKSDPSATVRGRTSPAPLSAARLDGSYRVTYTITVSGLVNQHTGQAITYTWRFKSRCPTPNVCGGRWTEQYSDLPDAHGNFNPIPGGFLGRMNGQTLSYCGTLAPENYSHSDSGAMRIHTIRAGLRGKEWVVLNFTGTLREYDPANGACTASTYKAQVDARRS